MYNGRTFRDSKDMRDQNLQSNGQGLARLRKAGGEGIFMSVTKKAEKIATALYMLTDLIPESDPMRNRIRDTSLLVLSETRRLSGALTGDLYFHLAGVIARSWELMSFMEVSVVVGFISDMNYRVLKTALIEFISDLRNRQRIEGFQKMDDLKLVDGTSSGFSLKSDFFKIDEADVREEERPMPKPVVKDTQIYKRHVESPLPSVSARPSPVSEADSKLIEERKEKIVNLLKTKGKLGMADIATAFPTFNPKTLQRDLNSLIEAGLITRTGEKRWSRYSASSR